MSVFVEWWLLLSAGLVLLAMWNIEGISDFFNTILVSFFLGFSLLLALCAFGIMEPGIIPKVYRSGFTKCNQEIMTKFHEIW